MDDLAEVILGLVLAVVIIVAIIAVVIYVVLPAAIFYFLGRQFYNQTQSYQFVNKSRAVLAAIGAVSIIVSFAMVLSCGLPVLIAVPVSVLLFLVAAIVVVAAWAYSKKTPFIDSIDALKKKQDSLKSREKEISKTIGRVRKANEKMQRKYGSMFGEMSKIDGYIHELCGVDARTYTIKKREWGTYFRSMDDGALDEARKVLIAAVKKMAVDNRYERTENSLRLCLVKKEQLERSIGKPASEMRENETKITGLQGEDAAVKHEMETLRSEIARNESTYAAFKATRIVLD